MRNLLKTIVLLILCKQSALAQFCNGNGNVVVYSNYDGGTINIVVDQNIPNLKVGVCTYEAVVVNIGGPFASNVTEVHYAGFNSYNDHCSTVIPLTVINAPPGAVVTSEFYPPATVADPNGNPNIVCGYSCEDINQGGCNTASQIASYFTSYFGGDLYMYYTQYGCWNSENLNISAGGNCCPGVSPLAPVASFIASTSTPCAGDCIDFLDLSSNNPDDWNWIFDGAEVTSSDAQDPLGICYPTPGTYTASLTASNASGGTTDVQFIEVLECLIPGCTYPQAINYNPLATVDDQSCQFICDGNDCPGDFTNDGIVGVSDLLEFISLYGTICD